MKKVLLLIIISILIFCSAGIQAYTTFPDCTGHWAETEINYIHAKGFINGYEDGTFRPDNRITRAEFVTILAHMNSVSKETQKTTSFFKDVDSTYWAFPYIEWAYKNNIVSGYEDDTFRPLNYVSREEIAVLVYRYITKFKKFEMLSVVPMDSFADDSKISSWAKEAVYAMRSSGILNGRGENKFEPLATATRAETARIITVYLQYYEPSEESFDDYVTLKYNDSIKANNVPTITENGCTLIAARPFFEAAGFSVKYYGITNLIAAYHDSKDIEFFIGKTLLFANGVKYALPTAAVIQNGTTFIPLTMASFAAGLDIEYNNNSGIINIKGSSTPIIVGYNNFYGSASNSAVNGSVSLTQGKSNGFWGTLSGGQMSYGSYFSGNGDLFCGQWQNGLLNGKARSVTMNGEFFYGTYSNGNPSNGVHYYSDGSIFEGTFQTGSNGAVYPQKGQYTDNNGKTYGNNTTVWNGGSLSKANW